MQNFFKPSINNDTSLPEKPWLTIDPLVSECLGIQPPSNEEVVALLEEHHYTLMPADAVELKDLGAAGNGLVAKKRITAGSALIYSGNFEFIPQICHKGLLWREPDKAISIANDAQIITSAGEIDKEKISEFLEYYLSIVKNYIQKEFEKAEVYFAPHAGVIYHKFSKTWYLILPKQFKNATMKAIHEFPALLKELDNAGINLLQCSFEALNQNQILFLRETVANFTRKHENNSDPFWVNSNLPYLLGVNGDTGLSPSGAEAQYCPKQDMASAASSINTRMTYLKIKNSPLYLMVLVANEDIQKGTVLTCDYGSLAKNFIPENQLLFWDKTAKPINPLHALRLNNLLALSVGSNWNLVLQYLLIVGTDDLWVLIKTKPDIFDSVYSIANNKKTNDFFKMIGSQPLNSIELANNIYKQYIEQIKDVIYFSFDLLPTKLNETESFAFINSPHNALNFLRNQNAVNTLKEEARKLTCNWFRYLRPYHYLDPIGKFEIEKKQFYTDNRLVNYKNGISEYKKATPESLEKAVQHWQKSLGFAAVEAQMESGNLLAVYIHNKDLAINKNTLTISWGLANAYKKLNLHKDALYFFNLAELHLRRKPDWADKICCLIEIQSRSNECRAAIEQPKIEVTNNFGK